LSASLKPMIFTAQNGDSSMARLLLEHGADLDIVSACQLGWDDLIPSLIQKNPTLVNKITNVAGLTPLHYAAQTNNLRLLPLLLEPGADPEAKDLYMFQATPLAWANFYLNQEAADILRSCASLGSSMTP